MLTRRAIVFLISDFHDEDFWRPMSVAAKRHDLIAVRLVDPRERTLPDVGLVELVDAETDRHLVLDTGSEDYRQALEALLEERRRKQNQQMRDVVWMSSKCRPMVVRSTHWRASSSGDGGGYGEGARHRYRLAAVRGRRGRARGAARRDCGQPQRATIGDLLTAQVTVTVPPGVAVTLPGEDADLGGAEVRALSTHEEKLADGTRQVMLSYQITFWEVEGQTVKAPPVAWRVSDGEGRQADRPETTVEIRTVLLDAEDIRISAGPRNPLRWHHYLLAALPVVAFWVCWGRHRGLRHRRIVRGRARRTAARPTRRRCRRSISSLQRSARLRRIRSITCA